MTPNPYDYGAVGDGIVQGLYKAFVEILLMSKMFRLVYGSVGVAVGLLLVYWIMRSWIDRLWVFAYRKGKAPLFSDGGGFLNEQVTVSASAVPAAALSSAPSSVRVVGRGEVLVGRAEFPLDRP